MRIASLLTCVVIFAAGCSADKPAAQFTARDSAGVRIVEHATLDGLATRGFAAHTPEVRIGTAMGDPAQVLDQATAGTVLVGGSIILLNAGASEVRFYDSGGSLVWMQGRRGEGPGEYVRPAAVFITAGDSLLVWDAGQRRLTMLTPDGAFGRDARLSGRLLNPQLVGTFADGALVVVGLTLDIKMGSSIQAQVGQDLRYSSVGEFEDSLGSYPGRTAQLIKDGQPVTSFGPEDRVDLRQVPFSGETQRAVAADGYWVGTTAQRQVEFHGRDGALRTIARWPGEPLAVTDEDRQAYLDERIDQAPTDEARTALRGSGVAGFEFTPTLPAHGPMIIDAAGNLWVSEFQRPGSYDPLKWTVFGPDGVAVSRVELPNNALLLWAGTDLVLVRVTDELGIETVELWKLA